MSILKKRDKIPRDTAQTGGLVESFKGLGALPVCWGPVAGENSYESLLRIISWARLSAACWPLKHQLQAPACLKTANCINVDGSRLQIRN